MYETITYEKLLGRMLARVPAGLDKREGSVIYDAVAPAAAELCQLYIALDSVLSETFADTASRQYLVRRAKERGLVPYPASYAVGKGVFNIDVPLGSRFNMDTYNFTVTEKLPDGEHCFAMKCEQPGEAPNHCIGRLTPIEYINGLTSAELVEILIPGEDDEPTEAFRKRYIDSFRSGAFGGNRADYTEKVDAIPGVGGVKVYRAWNGGGTVKLTIVDSEFKKPAPELVAAVQKEVDPQSGEGSGIAPIDHVVTVFGAAEEAVDIELSVTYENGWTFEDILPYIEEIVDEYFQELNRKWQDSGRIVVRVSQIESRLLELEGIADIGDTRLNGAAANFQAEPDSIVKRGNIIG